MKLSEMMRAFLIVVAAMVAVTVIGLGVMCLSGYTISRPQEEHMADISVAIATIIVIALGIAGKFLSMDE